jgi:hypothetical protein
MSIAVENLNRNCLKNVFIIVKKKIGGALSGHWSPGKSNMP